MQDGWQRRHAIQIAAQLPENTADALLVLELAKELVESFLGGAHRLRALPSAEIKAFSAASSSSLSIPGTPPVAPM